MAAVNVNFVHKLQNSIINRWVQSHYSCNSTDSRVKASVSMIEDVLEEDVQAEFKGATLSINPDDAAKPQLNKGDWSSNFITPLSSISHKIGATLWNKPPKAPTPTKENAIQQSIVITENPNNFFTFRESVLAKALDECKEQFLNEETDGPLINAFLLTQISHWNSDKERLLLLTPNSLVICKYDFIALKRLEYKKMPLEMIEEITIGELVYPSGSLIPQMNGLVDGLSNILETCLFTRWSKNDQQYKEINFFQPSNRNIKGIRLSWNNNRLSTVSEWNPFNQDVPYFTFTYHPLFFHKECTDEKVKNWYSVDAFTQELCKLIEDLRQHNTGLCNIQEGDIVLKSYIGLGSVIYNRNALGFFKVRGKFSF